MKKDEIEKDKDKYAVVKFSEEVGATLFVINKNAEKEKIKLKKEDEDE